MDKKIIVSICTGSTCYAQGRTILNELLKLAPEKYGDKVKVQGTPCLEVCSIDLGHSKAPYVKVNDELIFSATTDKVIAEIDKQLNCIEE